MIRVKAYYDFMFELDLSGINYLEENGVKVLIFENELQLTSFMMKNNLQLFYLPEGKTILIIEENGEKNVYGKVEKMDNKTT